MGPALVRGLCTCSLLLLGCREDAPSPPAVTTGGPGPVDTTDGSAPSPDDDGGRDHDDADALALALRECDNVEAVRSTFDERTRTTSTIAPDDFAITRVSTTWEGSCDDPKVVVRLSGGRCPGGNGHELALTFDANATDGVVHAGLVILLPEPGDIGIRARYTRPARTAPSGTWGTCDGASGTLDVPDTLDFDVRGEISARFLLELTPCDETTSGPMNVDGYLTTRLERTRAQYCPPP